MSQPPNSIKTHTLSEAESLLTRLNDAIIGHAKWLTEWNTNIICETPIADKYISEDSHRDCYFGQWYYRERANYLHQKSEFAAIEELHRTIHNKMSALAKKINRGGSITRTEYESFIDSEVSFSESVINLRDELYKFLLSFDNLTGVLNRQAFIHILEQEYARVIRFDEPCCVVLMDIDNFKNINDEFGHAAGDKALISIASFIIANLRPYDSICRYGGEEFLICMPKTSLEMAHTIIERIRKEMSQKKICVLEDNCIKIPASFGIAPMSAEEELKNTIEHADKALYRAKANGRNKVEVWAENT